MANLVFFEMDWRASEQILDRHLADFARQRTALENLGQAGNRLASDAGALASREDSGHLLAVRRGNRDQDFLNCVFAYKIGEIGARSQHGETLDTQSPSAGIVIEETEYRVGHTRVGPKLP